MTDDVQVEALALRLRPRTAMEAADLGVRLCQRAARSVYVCYGMVAAPVIALALASFAIAGWLPALIIWCAKPWLDRTILFVLSRAAFGRGTAPGDVWRAQRQVWWKQLLLTLTVRQLSPWRSFTEPVYQLEGLSVWRAGARVRKIRQRGMGSALMVASAFGIAEIGLALAVASLVFWLAPTGRTPQVFELFTGEAGFPGLALPFAYAIAVLFVEPFYVAAGFAMYLNRRVQLEAWDIEQEFRRAFARLGAPALLAAALLVATVPLAASPLEPSSGSADGERPGPVEITQAIERIKADPNLATERTIRTLRWRASTVPARSRTPAWLTWIAGFFRWLGESARLLVWCAAIVLAGLLVVFIGRLLNRYRAPLPEARFIAPTHVRDLDIRPESLPEDIGRAARDLWDSGEHRAALALLYRGLLSRLAHVHHVPIRDSSTEGDCLALAAMHLPQGRGEYTSELVQVWQRAVYGREEIPSLTVHRLCDEFGSALNSGAPLDAVNGAA